MDLKDIQRLGYNPKDESKEQFLSFVSRIFSAFRDPDDNILNDDPYDEYMNNVRTDYLQANTDKSIVAYIDGFISSYQLVNLSKNIEFIPEKRWYLQNQLEVLNEEEKQNIDLNQLQYLEYQQFNIKPGVAIVDNQIVEIFKETQWYFGIPKYTGLDANGDPIFDTKQFIEEYQSIYSLKPNSNYKAILSYNFINSKEDNSAKIRFITDLTAIDEPYLELFTFKTDKFGYVHQDFATASHEIKPYKHYTLLTDNTVTKYYLRDINPQKLSKKYMRNHKNLFKHLKNQLLETLSDSNISNKFFCKKIEKDSVHPSVRSGDIVALNPDNLWYPADVSRQKVNVVHGLYLRNRVEETHFIFTGGIIEITDDYAVDYENLILKNLIPGEYFVQDTKSVLDGRAPFISPIKVEDTRFVSLNNPLNTDEKVHIAFNISGLIDNVSVTIRNKKELVNGELQDVVGIEPFSYTWSQELDDEKSRNQEAQTVQLILEDEDLVNSGIPQLTDESGNLHTDKIEFVFTIDPLNSKTKEEKEQLVKEFSETDDDIIIRYFDLEPEQLKTLFDSDLSNVVGETDTFIINDKDFVEQTKDIKDNLIQKDMPLELIKRLVTNYDSDILTKEQLQLKKQDLENVLVVLNDIKDNKSLLQLGLLQKASALGFVHSNLTDLIKNIDYSIEEIEREEQVTRIEFKSTHQEYIETIEGLKTEIETNEDELKDLRIEAQAYLDEINLLNDYISDTQIEISRLQDEISILEAELTTLNTNFNDITIQKSSITSDLNNLQNLRLNLSSEIESLTTEIDNDLDSSSSVTTHPWMSTLFIPTELNTSLETVIPYLVMNTIDRYKYKLIEFNTEEQKLKDLIQTKNTKVQDLTENYSTFSEEERILKSEEIETLNNEIENLSLVLYSTNGIRYQLQEMENWVKENESKINSFYTKPTLVLGAEEDTSYVQDINDPNSKLKEFVWKFVYRGLPHGTYIVRFSPDGINNISERINVSSIAGTVLIRHQQDVYGSTGHIGFAPTWELYRVTDGPSVRVPTEEIINLNEINELLKGYIGSDGKHLFVEPDHNDDVIASSIYHSGFTESNSKNFSTLFPNNGIHNDFITRSEKLNALTITNEQYKTKSEELESVSNQLSVTNAEIISKNTQKNILVNDEAKQQLIKTELESSPYDITGFIGVTRSLSVNTSLWNTAKAKIQSTEYQLDLVRQELITEEEKYKELEDKAVNHFTVGLGELHQNKTEHQHELKKISEMSDIMFNKYNLVANICTNIESLIDSGLFELDPLTQETINLLNVNNNLNTTINNIETSLVKFPNSIYYQSPIEVIVGTGGIPYPEDLKPWIFTDSRGKIGLRKYPGAVSIGHAINENTLILNIQNTEKELWDLINVIGNDADFIEGVKAKFYEKSYTKRLVLIQENIRKIDNVISIVKDDVTKNKDFELDNDDLSFIDNLSAYTGKYGAEHLLPNLLLLKYWNDQNSEEANPYMYFNNSIVGDKSKTSFIYINDNLNSAHSYNYSVLAKLTQEQLNSYSLSTTDTEILEKLFTERLNINKEYHLMEKCLELITIKPFIEIQYKSNLESTYSKILLDQLEKEFLLHGDNPDPDILDEFEDISIALEDENTADYTIEASEKQVLIDAGLDKIKQLESKELDRIDLNIEQNILINYLKGMLSTGRVYLKEKKTFLEAVTNIKITLKDEVSKLVDLSITNNKYVGRLPKSSWDIFKITEKQKDMWNYTYLVISIRNLQTKLFNTIIDGQVQYSPLNNQIREAELAYQASVNSGDTENNILTNRLRVEALVLERDQFTEQLNRYVQELNVINTKYGITPITISEQDFVVNENLFIQNADDYRLEYRDIGAS